MRHKQIPVWLDTHSFPFEEEIANGDESEFPVDADAEFCVYCGAGIGVHRREGEGVCDKCR